MSEPLDEIALADEIIPRLDFPNTVAWPWYELYRFFSDSDFMDVASTRFLTSLVSGSLDQTPFSVAIDQAGERPLIVSSA